MKFSIVTISFNQRPYLEEALTSVLEQDHTDLEYIVVDPGSTDGSRELIQQYSHRLSHVVFEPDRGASDGLNKGFQRASGEVFGFLNSDDVLLPGAIRAASELFEQSQDCDIVMGNGFMVDAQGLPIRRIRAAGFTVRRYFYGAATWLQQSTFFRRAAFEAVGGFNEKNRSCWDGELMVEMISNGAKIRYLDRDLSFFRVHPESITGSKRHKQMMQADTERMFARVSGRSWTGVDTLRSWFFRTERLLTHPGAAESAIKARLYRT
ncbi:MAG TPA: glycosyltransferase family 2 protein [Acidobacteriaceae bacterium]|jgi:glycosyltransferase involved in cell wall biosynthesis